MERREESLAVCRLPAMAFKRCITRRSADSLFGGRALLSSVLDLSIEVSHPFRRSDPVRSNWQPYSQRSHSLPLSWTDTGRPFGRPSQHRISTLESSITKAKGLASISQARRGIVRVEDTIPWHRWQNRQSFAGLCFEERRRGPCIPLGYKRGVLAGGCCRLACSLKFCLWHQDVRL